MQKKYKTVLILGATAVGKSALAVQLAKKYNGEIISADSVQIFRGLDIGSAKISAQEMGGVAHFGINILPADAQFSTHDFVEYSKQKIREISSRAHLPIVVGGTGLYVTALVQGFNLGGVEKDETLRAELEKLRSVKGVDALFELLQSLDSEAARTIDRKNPVRLVRAIEIAKGRGKKSAVDATENEIEPLVLVLERPREEIYAAIDARVDDMMRRGFLQEVQRLKNAGLTAENQSMRAIGYKELLAHLNGQLSLEKAVELIKQHSRNYAKRQNTFFKKVPGAHYVNMTDKAAALKEIDFLLKDFLK